MSKYITIERPNGQISMVRSCLDTTTESPITEHEQIINELYCKVKELRQIIGNDKQCYYELDCTAKGSNNKCNAHTACSWQNIHTITT